MIHRFVCISLLWALASGQGRADDVNKQELAKLDGTWVVVKIEMNGQSLLEKNHSPEQKLVIKGGKVTSGAKEAELSKILDPSKKPKTITGPLDERLKFYGIYEVDGDEIRVCGDIVDTATEKNPEGRRPKGFDSKKGILVVLKREKK